jgi:hypothetical protein
MQHSLWINISLPLPFNYCYRPVRQGSKSAAFYYKQGVMPSLSRTLPDGFSQTESCGQDIRYLSLKYVGHPSYVNRALVWLGLFANIFGCSYFEKALRTIAISKVCQLIHLTGALLPIISGVYF